MRQAFTLALLLLSAPAFGQTHVEIWKGRAARIVEIRGTNPPLADKQAIEAEVDVNANLSGFLQFVAAETLARELRVLEDRRTDKQLGAPAAAGGSTTLVTKGAVPAVLALAVEHGAMTQTVDGTSVTVRGNAVGWLDLLKGQDFISSYADDSRLTRALRRLSYSFTFNASPAQPATAPDRPTDAEVKETIDASERQLTAYSVRLTLLDRRDPRRADNRTPVDALLEKFGTKLLEAPDFMNEFFQSSAYRTWLQETVVLLASPDTLTADDVERLIYQRLDVLRQRMRSEVPDFDAGTGRFVAALGSFEGARAAVFKNMQRRLVVAAEMVRQRAAQTPGVTTYRVVADGLLGRRKLDLTSNFAIKVQDSGVALVPHEVSTGGLRDVEMAVSLEIPLGSPPTCLDDLSGIGRPALAIEYLSRKLLDGAVVNFAGHDFTVEPGWLHVVQGKITMPLKGGVKVPLSVSIANRTELLREKNVRGHIGLTFDLDVLASAVRR